MRKPYTVLKTQLKRNGNSAVNTGINKAIEKSNKDMQAAHQIFMSFHRPKQTLLNMYENRKSKQEDVEKTKASVVKESESMMKRLQDEKRNMFRLKIHADSFESKFSDDTYSEADSMTNKVARLGRELENLGNVLAEEEDRFDNALRKIGQVTNASENLDDLTKKLEAFELAASRQKSRVELGVGSSQLEAHMASHEMGSSPEKARPAKRQRYSHRALSVGPSETLSDLLRQNLYPQES